MTPILAAIVPILTKIVGNIIPDKTEQSKAEAELYRQLLQHSSELNLAAADIIKAEAASGSWLAASWRPITMLTFVALIVARWLGWTADNIQPEEYLKLWDIVELGLGGYVIGRSVEKVAPSLAGGLKR